MSDDQPQRRDPAGGGGQPDDTRPFSPFDDDDDATRLSPRSGDADATRVSPVQPDGDPRSGDAWVFDRTDSQPRADDPTAVAARAPRPDSTSIMPPVDDGTWGAAEAPWSGRAEVRPPRPGDYSTTDWATEPPPEPRGRWWMPILVGILALLLLAALGWGIWLIVQARGDGTTPAPTPTAPAATTGAETTGPTTEPTTEAPTTNSTTAPPTTAEVTIPALRGLSQDEARQALSRRGLSSRLRYVRSGDAPPGTVIDSDPAEGQEVPPDTVVTLVIAAQPTPSPTATATGDQPDED